MFPVPIISNTNIAPIVTTKIVQVVGGASHICVLYNNGELYGLGKGDNYQLGNGSTTAIVSQWLLMATNVRLVASGQFGTVIVKTDGTIWLVGRIQHVNPSDTGSSYAAFTNVSSYFSSISIGSIQDIKLSTACILVLMSNGDFYGIGRPFYQQLGGNTTSIATLSKRIALQIRKIYSSTTGTAFITSDDRCYVAGGNTSGTIGAGSTNPVQAYREMVSTASTIGVQDIWLSENHSQILSYTRSDSTKSLSLYGTGTADSGSLPTSTTSYTLNSTMTGKLSSFPLMSGTGGYYTFGTGLSTGLWSSGLGSVSGNSGAGNSATWSTRSTGYENTDKSLINGICCNSSNAAFLFLGNKLYYSGTGTNYGLGTVSIFTALVMPY